MEESRRPLLALFERALNGRPGVRVFDPTPWLCPDSLCVPLRGGMVLFSDAHHLSVAGVRSLLGPALQFLDWTGGLSADVQVSALEPGLARRSLLAVRR